MKPLFNWEIFSVKWTSRFLLCLIFILIARSAGACTVSTTGVVFANYDVFSLAPLTSTGSVTVTCDLAPLPDVTISIGPSSHSGGFLPRQMKHAALPDLLSYNLYIDTGGTSIWGDGTGGTRTVFLKNVRRRRPITVPIYGIVPPAQNISAGSYSDVLTVTIVW
jgi:spore coat protein U-like protein